MLSFKKPGKEKIRRLATSEHFHLKRDELEGVRKFFDALSGMIKRVEELYESQSKPGNGKGRDPGYQPTKKQDPYNSFTRMFLIRGRGNGLLKGKKIGVKDNINISGIPTTNASSLSMDFVPNEDATIITRLLEAGADIVGKLNMDNLSFSGTSETSIFGPVKNTLNPKYSPGGSSSGAGAAVASNSVDIAIGVDQGGSARVPACCTGVVSIKPTHGLVPTYGLTYLDHTLDHICPVARSVEDVAATLEVIAGYDKRDPNGRAGHLRVG